MTRLFHPLTLLLLALPHAVASANPWVVQADELKVTGGQSQNHLTYQQSLLSDPPRYVTRKARKTDRQIYLEYGLTEKLSLTGKFFASEFVEDSRQSSSDVTEIGARIDTPFLGSGLLPPYFYAFIDYLIDNDSLYRDRPASVEVMAAFSKTDFFGASQTEAGQSVSDQDYGIALSLGDKILLNDYSVTQQLRYGWGGNGLSDWRNWEYKFELGMQARVFIGQQSLAYQNHETGYATLGHQLYVEWRLPGLPMSLQYARRKTRDNSQPKQFQTRQIEIRYVY